MSCEKKNCIIVKVLSTTPTNKNYPIGSFKFLPVDLLGENFTGLKGDIVKVKVTKRTCIECEIFDTSLECVNPTTPILDILGVLKIEDNYDYYNIENHMTADDEDSISQFIFPKKFRFDLRRLNKYKNKLEYKEYVGDNDLNEEEENGLRILHNAELLTRNISIYSDSAIGFLDELKKLHLSDLAVKKKFLEIKNEDLFSIFDVPTYSNSCTVDKMFSNKEIQDKIPLNHVLCFAEEKFFEIIEKSKKSYRRILFEFFEKRQSVEAKAVKDFLYNFTLLSIFDFNSQQTIAQKVVDLYNVNKLDFDANFGLKVFIPELMIQSVVEMFETDENEAEKLLLKFYKIPLREYYSKVEQLLGLIK